MITKPFDKITLSTLGMGNMRLPANESGENGKSINWEKAHEILDYAMANGINYYDTAYVYNGGESEACVGEGMKKFDRASFYLATKFHVNANPDYKQVFETQLERLQTDHIDFYLIHCVMDNNIDTYLTDGSIEYFFEQKRLGKITYLGFSAHCSLETLTRMADHHKWDFGQLQINYRDWYYGAAQKEYQILKDRDIPIVVMEPVRGGSLANIAEGAAVLLKNAHPDWSIASWALRFVRTLPGVCVTLSGMSNMEQIIDNVKTFSDENTLSDADMEVLKKAAELNEHKMAIPCTGCRYCCDDCPMQINIPEYLKLLNDYKVKGELDKDKLAAIESEGKPSDCIGCGACTGHCPQSIDIPSLMEELAEVIG